MKAIIGVCTAVFFAGCVLMILNCGDKSTDSTPCHILNIQTVGWGSVTVSPLQECYEEGAQITLTATADQGWEAEGWEGNASGTANPLLITMGSSNMLISAHFALIEYNITINVDPAIAGTVALDPNQTTYHLNDDVALTASANNGYSFDRWSGDTTSILDTLTIKVIGDVSLNAHYVGAGPDSVELSGTISWPGNTLSYPVLVLLNDSLTTIQAAWLITGGAETVAFTVKFSINDVPDSYIHAVDNLDNDNLLFEAGEPWSCFDPDGDLYCNYLYYTSGQIIDDVDIELFGGPLLSGNDGEEIGPLLLEY